MNNSKTDVYVYGTGLYYERFKLNIKDTFNVCGYIDSDVGKKMVDGFEIVHKISELKLHEWPEIKILIMVENPKHIFEIISLLSESRISANDVILGISYYGILSKYFSFSLFEDWKLAIKTEYGVDKVLDAEGFYKRIKTLMSQVVTQRGNAYKYALQELYEDELKIMWMDGNLWCADHNADIYYRFEKTGFYNWSYALTFSMIALNQFKKPKVLELGCGDAYWFKNVFKSVDGIKYIGCDISDEFIKRNKEDCLEQKNSKFIKCDITRELPNLENHGLFDVIFWMESYCVFTDQEHENILKNIKKLVESSGMLFVCDFYSSIRKSPWKYAINSVSDKSKLKETFSSYFKNVSIYFDEGAEFFCLYASDVTLPLNF